MLQNFKVDQARTFVSLLLLGVDAKTAFGDPFRQEVSKDGTPKWTAQIAAEFVAFGRPQRELINVGLVSDKNPGDNLAPGTPVEVSDFEIGVMEKKNREGQVVGVQVWYRAGGLRPLSAGSKPRPAAEAVA
ncbi:MAG: hypothetical protein JWP75_3192 [Frondihabitans sp.]|uniref:hypothetical protein n=1 Tax=Pseudonocardia sp. TaxID=60912 RepID=UPI001ACF4CB5|nr:hypothetical protein [Pseudonocardia sp.]MBN9096959.1 hypothetical protein [Pseudonocardia sp.]MCU1529429.1 hypothetical protein [Frondihabitans sp.]